VCTSVSAIKYLYKYVYKGYDKAEMSLDNDNNDEDNALKNENEIKKFLDARYVSSIEAC
jgi:hypothetical protein